MARICEFVFYRSLDPSNRMDTSTELLLSKGYQVHGIIRRSSSFNTGRLHHLYEDQHERESLPTLHPPSSNISRPRKIQIALRRLKRQHQPRLHHRPSPALRDLQPRRPIARQGLL